jgi:hypothetical protein
MGFSLKPWNRRRPCEERSDESLPRSFDPFGLKIASLRPQ